MRFRYFEVKNFRGIEHARVDLHPYGANISTFIGLNESGKTTLLEAISQLAATNMEQALYKDGAQKVNPTTFVPKHRKSDFTGDISVSAEIEFEADEKITVINKVEEKTGCKFDRSTVSDIFKWTRTWRFEDSDFKSASNTWSTSIYGVLSGEDQRVHFGNLSAPWKVYTSEVGKIMPEVVYFPTFIFNQPDMIILNPGDDEGPINKIYKDIVQRVAQSLHRPLDINKHIVDRIVTPDTPVERALLFWGLGGDKVEQVNAALNEISAHLTETVFASWSRIFGGDFKGREIQLRPGIDPTGGRATVYLQFLIKDGAALYNISERSLGFRWFFSFLLFTLYRVSGDQNRKTLFLLDEPASNLHSRAQMQLLDSFPKIASGSNQIIYSTHSHYMINPDWLDQAFIVSNSAVDYDDVNDKQRLTPFNTNIVATKYRQFVGEHPSKTTYFQPVLDKLDAVPSRFDLLRPSVLVEGKGDYLILEYGRKVVLKSEASFAIVPTRGATSIDNLIGLFLGWGIPFAICLDSDAEGRRTSERLKTEWGLKRDDVMTLADVSPDLDGKSIEGMLEEEDLALISAHYQISERPSKSQIQLFFSEMLAAGRGQLMSEAFKGRVQAFERAVQRSLAS